MLLVGIASQHFFWFCFDPCKFHPHFFQRFRETALGSFLLGSLNTRRGVSEYAWWRPQRGLGGLLLLELQVS
jgi:hypothetical protein